jgi:hypothetical protein
MSLWLEASTSLFALSDLDSRETRVMHRPCIFERKQECGVDENLLRWVVLHRTSKTVSQASRNEMMKSVSSLKSVVILTGAAARRLEENRRARG